MLVKQSDGNIVTYTDIVLEYKRDIYTAVGLLF